MMGSHSAAAVITRCCVGSRALAVLILNKVFSIVIVSFVSVVVKCVSPFLDCLLFRAKLLFGRVANGFRESKAGRMIKQLMRML